MCGGAAAEEAADADGSTAGAGARRAHTRPQRGQAGAAQPPAGLSEVEPDWSEEVWAQLTDGQRPAGAAAPQQPPQAPQQQRRNSIGWGEADALITAAELRSQLRQLQAENIELTTELAESRRREALLLQQVADFKRQQQLQQQAEQGQPQQEQEQQQRQLEQEEDEAPPPRASAASAAVQAQQPEQLPVRRQRQGRKRQQQQEATQPQQQLEPPSVSTARRQRISFAHHVNKSVHLSSHARRVTLADVTPAISTPAERMLWSQLYFKHTRDTKTKWQAFLTEWNSVSEQHRVAGSADVKPKTVKLLQQYHSQVVRTTLTQTPVQAPGLMALPLGAAAAAAAAGGAQLMAGNVQLMAGSTQLVAGAAVPGAAALAPISVQLLAGGAPLVFSNMVGASGSTVAQAVGQQPSSSSVPVAPKRRKQTSSVPAGEVAPATRQANASGPHTCRSCWWPVSKGGKASHSKWGCGNFCQHNCAVCGQPMTQHHGPCPKP